MSSPEVRMPSRRPFTVLLALTLDKERVRPAQLAGLGLAAVALVLTAV